MDNARGRRNEGGPSGVSKFKENHDQNMEYAEDATHNSYHTDKVSESRFQLSPSFGAHHHRTLISNPQHQTQSLPQHAAYSVDLFNETTTRVRISWNHGGKQVAVTGSWDNWETRELLQKNGEKFVVIKTLSVGIYHYLFIVDGWLVYAPDLPWFSDDSGNAYNVLDLQGYVSEFPESMAEFESPHSPPSSYDNPYFNEDDFSRPPPELPQQLQGGTILNHPCTSLNDKLFPITPQCTELNHLYIQNNNKNQFVALGSTHRVHQKYITMFLFKPLSRTS